MSTLILGVNIDHVATLRQARYALTPDAPNAEPDLVAAAGMCERAGARSITVHLREDRRHAQDRDIARLRASVQTKLNFEMGNSPEILAIALATAPADACLVPENRQEITTEGGLDVAGQRIELADTVDQLREVKTRVSMFIDPIEAQIRASAEIGATAVELHTGAFANAIDTVRAGELRRLAQAARLAHELGLQVNAGHGLNYQNLPLLLGAVPHLRELNIGHSIVSRSLFVGLDRAVGEMLSLMAAYAG